MSHPEVGFDGYYPTLHLRQGAISSEPEARVLDDELRIVLGRERDGDMLTAQQFHLLAAESDSLPSLLYGIFFDASAHRTFTAVDIGVPNLYTDGLGG